MNSLNLQNNIVYVFYCEHKEVETYLGKKLEAKKMIRYFFDKYEELKEVIVTKNKEGKPELSDPQINISISNSKQITVCAISKSAIGIDLEFKRIVEEGSFEFISKLYGKYFKIRNLRDWVKLESSLKLRNLKLESEGKGEGKGDLELHNIKHLELKIDSRYITYLSLNKEKNTAGTTCYMHKYTIE